MQISNRPRRRGLPKYFRISQEIVREIKNGSLSDGQQVPSENQIIETYKVSNTTARKALGELERGGWVRRIKGKGTFVCKEGVERSVNRIISFTKNMLEQGRTPSTRLISAKVRHSNCSVTVHGRQYTLKGPFAEIVRLRLADGIPVMRETRCISSRLCPGIEKKDLEGSLYAIYKDAYNIDLTRIYQMLGAITIDRENMRILDVEEPTPAFLIEGVTFCAKELIVELEESIYRADMYRFFVEAT